MEETNESREFWLQKENETGKPIIFRSFARFLGEKGGQPLNLSGLLYCTDTTAYFEDFEKSSMLDMFMRTKKKYDKFFMDFPLSDAEALRKVTERSALDCICGHSGQAKSPGPVSGLFSTPVWELKMTSGNLMFFELFDTKGLVELIG